MPRSVGLAQAWGTIGLNGRSVLTTVTGASVTVCNQGTSTPISATIYADASSGTTLSNPFTTDATGTRQFYLEDPAVVTLIKTSPGYTFANEDIFVGEATAGGGSTTLSGLTDVAITSAATNQELVNQSGTSWINILHRYRPQGYLGYAGDGATDGTGTDNSTVLNSMFTEAHNAGRGYVELPNHTICAKNVVAAYPNLHVDFNGATIVQHTSSTTSDDLLRGWNFNTLTTTSTNVTGGTVPYRFKLMNGTLMQPTGKGRHLLAAYAYSFGIENMELYPQSVGSALWLEYGTTSETFISSGTLLGMERAHLLNIRVFDNPSTSAVTMTPAANNYSVNVTAATIAGGTTLTITTNGSHFAATAQSVTLASIGGITGASGAFAVASTPAYNQITVTGTFTGAYTSGGTVSYPVSAAIAFLGPHDSMMDQIVAAASSHVAGRRGLLMGSNGSASATGTSLLNSHLYDNFDVVFDANTSHVLTGSTTQIEAGISKCLVMVRSGGSSIIEGSIFDGSGGVVGLYVGSGCNSLQIRPMIFQIGSGNAPASGYDNVYIENHGGSHSQWDVVMQHPYSTSMTLGLGSAPSDPLPPARIMMDNFGGGAVTAGWCGGQTDSVHWKYLATGDVSTSASSTVATSGTITPILPVMWVTTSGAVTGVILAKPTSSEIRDVTIVNDSANSITFAASGTSFVADGTSDIIAANTAGRYVYVDPKSLWYRV